MTRCIPDRIKEALSKMNSDLVRGLRNAYGDSIPQRAGVPGSAARSVCATIEPRGELPCKEYLGWHSVC